MFKHRTVDSVTCTKAAKQILVHSVEDIRIRLMIYAVAVMAVLTSVLFQLA